MGSSSRWAATLCLLSGVQACAGDAGSQASGEADAAAAGASVESGEAVYREPLAEGNTFACATCHALSEPAPDGLRRPGHPIGDAARRSSYKNGQLEELRDAVNTCVTEWMNADALAADDERWLSLRRFLEDRAGDAAPTELAIDIVEPPDDLAGGEAADGQATFNASCAVCHGEDAVGTELAPSLVGAQLEAERIAERVRSSGPADSAVYDGLTGGVMPFWSADRLSDEELLDVVAYVEAIGRQERATSSGEGGVSGDSGCARSHPSVGKRGTFRTLAHGVMGTARVVDDCTIVLEDFRYDGGGIDVQVYGGLGGDYDPPVGFSLSEDLLGQRFEGETLTLRLPAGRTLDELDGVSIWCVAVGANFGDALFE